MATFKKEWFNPLYFILNDALKKHPEISKVFCYGSKSSAKTFSIAQYISKECYLYNTDAICFRKESTRIKTTLKKTFSKAIKQTRLQNGYTTQDFQFKTTKGNNIVLTGLDNEDKVKGLEEFGYLLFDELDHYKFEEYEQADLSFRGESAKVFFATWNPTSDKLWIKPYLETFTWYDYELQLPSPQSFVKISECGTMLYIKTVYTDNYWTVGSPCGTYGFKDEKLLHKYEVLKQTNYKSWLVNCMGEWGIAEVKNPFITAMTDRLFNPELSFDPRLPIWASFDINNDPLTCVVSQCSDGQHSKTSGFIRTFDEFKISNDVLMEYKGWDKYMVICHLIRKKYPNAPAYITGDSSGWQGNAMFKADEPSMYIYVAKMLRSNPQTMLKTPKYNLKHTVSKTLCNSALSFHPQLQINPNTCPVLANEIKTAQTDENGKLIKDRETNPLDSFDAWRYQLSTVLYPYWLKNAAELI